MVSSLSRLSIIKRYRTAILLQGDTRQERHKRVELLGFFCTFLPFILWKGVRILPTLPVWSYPGGGQVEQTTEQNLKDWADNSLETEVSHLPGNWLLPQQNHRYLWPLPK